MGLLQKLVYQLTIRPRQNKLKKLLGEEVVGIYPNGSRYVCNPPVMHTDIDFLVLSNMVDVSTVYLIGNGYRQSESKTQYIDCDEGVITCWRKGSVNVVLTGDVVYAIHHQTATHLVKRYNVRDKLLRVATYEAVRGNLKTSLWGEKGRIIPDDARMDLPELASTLEAFNGPYGPSMINAYRAKYGLVL